MRCHAFAGSCCGFQHLASLAFDAFTDSLRALLDTSLDMLSRPRFVCDTLVDTTCQDKEDLANIATPPKTLAAALACRKFPLLVFDAAQLWDIPYKAVLVTCAQTQAPLHLPASPSCGVTGCTTQLCTAPPATKLHGAAFERRQELVLCPVSGEYKFQLQVH